MSVTVQRALILRWYGGGCNDYNSATLIPAGSTNSEGCLSQPNNVLWRKIGESVDLPCAISVQCSGRDWTYEWLTCQESSCFSVMPHEKPQKYKLNGASLHITALRANDSGIYHCAAVSAGERAQGSQHVGLGTTLVVKGRRNLLSCQWKWFNVTGWLLWAFLEKIKTTVRSIFLWIGFALLIIYSLAVVTLIVKMV